MVGICYKVIVIRGSGQLVVEYFERFKQFGVLQFIVCFINVSYVVGGGVWIFNVFGKGIMFCGVLYNC